MSLCPPFPAWTQTDDALASVSALIRRFHDASRGFDLSGYTWSDEMADPAAGPVICHNEVCLENVVFRDGRAVGLLDFDFAALAERHGTSLGWRPCAFHGRRRGRGPVGLGLR
jgi:aminoglycoside phosphotransferase (APT) family kinase protein